MTDRRGQILDAAVKCFSEKGFQATSIQDIADRSDMAKGSLYFYFKSKDDILVSVFKRYIGLIRDKFRSSGREAQLSPAERLEHRIKYRFDIIEEYRDFISLMMQERFERSEEILRLFHQYALTVLEDDAKTIIDRYGASARPHAYDLAMMLGSIMNGFIGFMFMNGWKLDANQVTAYVIRRMDEMVQGLTDGREQPILRFEDMRAYMESSLDRSAAEQNGTTAALQRLRAVVESLELEAELAKELAASLDVMENELNQEHPKPVLLKGMLAFLKSLKIQELKQEIAELERSLDLSSPT